MTDLTLEGISWAAGNDVSERSSTGTMPTWVGEQVNAEISDDCPPEHGDPDFVVEASGTLLEPELAIVGQLFETDVCNIMFMVDKARLIERSSP